MAHTHGEEAKVAVARPPHARAQGWGHALTRAKLSGLPTPGKQEHLKETQSLDSQLSWKFQRRKDCGRTGQRLALFACGLSASLSW